VKIIYVVGKVSAIDEDVTKLQVRMWSWWGSLVGTALHVDFREGWQRVEENGPPRCGLSFTLLPAYIRELRTVV
jgi:hypothetical protein